MSAETEHVSQRPAGRTTGLRVAVIGGGLAGLAAAAAVRSHGAQVTVFEARRRCGGRAASFEDPDGLLVDACQHVAMGCCTNFLDLCRQAGLGEHLRRDRTLWFIGPDGSRAACRSAKWLPAPLHLAPLLLGLPQFSLAEKWSLALGMLRLARCADRDDPAGASARAWLASHGQPARVIDLFWQPVIESALGESIDQVSVPAARKVAIDAFLAHRDAADLYVPLEPLGTLFGERLVGWLERAGVVVKTGSAVTACDRGPDGAIRRVRCGDDWCDVDAVIVAVPWRHAMKLLPDVVPAADDRLLGSPIAAVHMWFDRDVIDLPHAVLVGRVSQWVFRGEAPGYCQVVISAARGLLGGDRDRLLEAVVAEVRDVFPAARAATLRDAKVVTDPTAVLSVRPGVEAARPAATTNVPNLFLAGDWTATGWPSTMEGAVRSGRLGAEALFAWSGRRAAAVVPDLQRSWLTSLLGAFRPPATTAPTNQ